MLGWVKALSRTNAWGGKPQASCGLPDGDGHALDHVVPATVPGVSMCEGMFEFWISPHRERSWAVFQRRKAAIRSVASLKRDQTGRWYWYREVDAADVAELAWVMNRLLEIACDYGTAVPITVVAPGSAQPTAAADGRSAIH